jgi:hypothetical protein
LPKIDGSSRGASAPRTVLFFCVWALWLSSEYWAFGAYSYQRQQDSAEAHTAYYTALPGLIERGQVGYWHTLAGSGVEALANLRGDLLGVEAIFRVVRHWSAGAVLLWLQTVMAGCGAASLLRRHFGVQPRVALLAGAYYAMSPMYSAAYSGFAPWNGFYLPALPFALLALDWCLRSTYGLAVGAAIGALLAFGAPTASGLLVFPAIAGWLLVMAPSASRWRTMRLVLCCAIGFVVVKAPVLVSLATVVQDSQRVMRAGVAPATTVLGLGAGESLELLLASIGPIVLLVMVRRRELGWRVIFSAFAMIAVLYFIGLATRRDPWNIEVRAYLAGIVGLTWPLVLWLLVRRRDPHGDQRIDRTLMALLAIAGLVLVEPVLNRAIAAGGGAVGSYHWGRFATLFAPLVCTVAAALQLNAWRPSRQKVIAVTTVLALLLAYVSVRINMAREHERRRGSHHVGLLAHPTLQALARRTRGEAPFRVATFADRNANFGGQHPGFAWAHGLETADLYLNVYPLRYHEFWSRVIAPTLERRPDIRAYFNNWGNMAYLFNPDAPLFGRLIAPPSPRAALPFDLDLLSLANVRYVISRVALNDPRLRLQPDDDAASSVPESVTLPRLFVYENTTALLRYFIASMGERLPVRVIECAADRIVLEAAAPSGGFLIASQSYSPYWRAEVNGAPVPVVPANDAFMGFDVQPGSSRITLTYRPPAAFGGRWQPLYQALLLMLIAAILVRIDLSSSRRSLRHHA